MHNDYQALNNCWQFVNIQLVPSYLDKMTKSVSKCIDFLVKLTQPDMSLFRDVFWTTVRNNMLKWLCLWCLISLSIIFQ